MRKTIHPKLSAGRIREGKLGSDDSYGLNGAFFVTGPTPIEQKLVIIASDGVGDNKGWEHVSVSMKNRCPNWPEMNFVKELFWEDDECVMQLHPPKKDYVNCHPYCLHLWRPIDDEIPRPPPLLVGPKT